VHSPGATASRNPFEGLNPFEGSEGSNPFSDSSADAADGADAGAGAGDRGSVEKLNPFSSGSVKALEVGGGETVKGWCSVFGEWKLMDCDVFVFQGRHGQ